MGSEEKKTKLFQEWNNEVLALLVLRYMKEGEKFYDIGYLIPNMETSLGITQPKLEWILLKLEEAGLVVTKILQDNTAGLGRFYKVADGVEVTITGSIKKPAEALSL